jgi:hypothetical protein
VYQEHTLVHDLPGYQGSPEYYSRLLSDVIRDATRSGARSGSLWGLLAGGVAGLIVGLALGLTGVLGGAAAVLTGLGVAGAGAGLGALFGWLRGTRRGTSALSEERLQQVRAYVARLGARGAILQNGEGRDLARDAADLWSADPSAYPLTVDVRRHLLRELLNGLTLDAEERAIIKILENSEPDEILQLLDPTQGVSFQDLRDNLHGAEERTFLNVLAARFPQLGAEEGITREGIGACSADQAVALYHARRWGRRMIERTIDQLRQPDHPRVRRALDCYFPAANATQVAAIRARYERMLTLLPSRRYLCAESGMAAFTVSDGGEEHTMHCINERANVVFVEGQAQPEVFLCWEFFTEDTARQQAMTIVHEGAHATGLEQDHRYHPRCGLALATALANPDSYAYLAASLDAMPVGASATSPASARATPASMPTAAGGNP